MDGFAYSLGYLWMLQRKDVGCVYDEGNVQLTMKAWSSQLLHSYGTSLMDSVVVCFVTVVSKIDNNSVFVLV